MMTLPIKLYFDKVTKGLHGKTTDGENILYNLKQISEEWFQKYTDMLLEENQATIFIPTGRYISIITASLDQNGKFMTTFDLMDNEEFAKYQASLSEGNEELFMAVFYKIRETYKADYNKFVLTEGKRPQLNT